MGHAQRRDARDTTPLAATTCADSPHCLLPPQIALRFGGLDGLWLHAGPIGRETTTLAFHRAERAPSERNAGRLDVPTPAAWRDFEDCHIDAFALDHRPGGGARRLAAPFSDRSSALWRVFAVAWCDGGVPYVSWVAPGFGLPYEGYHDSSGPTRPTASTRAECDRLHDLLEGRRPRRGRPSRWEDPGWRAIADRAVARKAEHPGLPWRQIADSLNIPERTLRLYRQILERERGDAGQLHLLDEGGE